MLVAAIAAVIAAIVFNVGGLVSNTFAGTCDEVKANISTSNSCG
jgi:Flp pilus assembly pilin Flp